MWNIYYIIVQGYVIRMELMVDLAENKSASMHSPQGFQLLGGGVNVLVWLVAIPHPLREREQSCSSRAAKATNAGVGVTQEHLQSAPLSEGKLFSDTLPLCSRYRFENLSLASFRLNQKSLTSPRPLSIQLRKDHSRPMCYVILSPISIQGRRIPKTLQKGDSSDSCPQITVRWEVLLPISHKERGEELTNPKYLPPLKNFSQIFDHFIRCREAFFDIAYGESFYILLKI